MQAAPMVYSRVLRAIAAVHTNADLGANEFPMDQLAKQLNDEFSALGVRIRLEDLAGHNTALEIAEHITCKIQ